MDAQKKNIAVVQFPSGFKDYDFKNPYDDLEVGDKVVCDTSHGVTVGQITGFRSFSLKATKLIIQKVDLASHQVRVAKMAEEAKKQLEIKNLKASMEKRRKQIEDVQVYALLANSDPEMKALLDKLNSLEGRTNV